MINAGVVLAALERTVLLGSSEESLKSKVVFCWDQPLHSTATGLG